MRTVKAQISLRIRAGWSGPSLFVDVFHNIYWFSNQGTKALIRLFKCTDWFGFSLAVCVRRPLIFRCVSYSNNNKPDPPVHLLALVISSVSSIKWPRLISGLRVWLEDGDDRFAPQLRPGNFYTIRTTMLYFVPWAEYPAGIVAFREGQQPSMTWKARASKSVHLVYGKFNITPFLPSVQ